MCTFINLLKQYFLLLILFCIYLERCSNFELEAIQIFYVTVSQCKWVSGVDTYEAEIAADSMIWELFAWKSAECLNLRNSFITISTWGSIEVQKTIDWRSTEDQTLGYTDVQKSVNKQIWIIWAKTLWEDVWIYCTVQSLQSSLVYMYVV